MAGSNTIRRFVRRFGFVLLALALILLGFWLRGLFVSSNPSATDEHDGHAHASTSEAKPQTWTCSMHPQIRLPKPGLCPICNMELIPAGDGESANEGGPRELTVSETAAKLMDVETVPVERKAVTATVRMVGKVEYDETRLAYITAWIPGRLDRLFVDYTGVPVREGDHMVSLYSPQLLSAQEELLQAIKAAERISASDSAFMRETTQATAKAAREKLRLWGLTAQQIAEIEKSGEVTDHMTIYAPAGGIVIHKNALEGMYVEEGTRIYTIADLSQVWVKLDAYESDLEWLRYGQTVEFTTVAYPGVIFTGTVSFIDPVLDERTRTAKIRVNVANPDGKLKPEMFVKAVVLADVAAGGRVMDAALAGKWICPMHPEIVKDESGRCDTCGMPLVTTESLGYTSDEPTLAQKPLVIPVSAALVTGTRAVVYVQRADGDKPTFEGREIVLGPRAGDYYLVRSGLAEGELVVVKGNFKIDSALQILAKPSMMTPAGGAGGGGHGHGDHGPGGDADGKHASQDLRLGALAAYQLRQVVQAGRQVAASLEARDLSGAKEAFAQVSQALSEIDMHSMTGEAHTAWLELSMGLTNDAVEGAAAKTIEEAQRVGALLAGNLEHLQTRMGLSMDHAGRTRPVLGARPAEQLGAVYASYFAMQRALAADDARQAMTAAAGALESVEAVDVTVLKGASHRAWMKTSAQLREVLSDAAATDDIKTLREDFYLASQHLIGLSKVLGAVGGDAAFVMHCPMAFDNKGAQWLQDSQDLRNPYFGAAMLKCGTIEEVIGGAQTEKARGLDD
jgi:Cu(I)/Ag(I) efflux system membrane fusion protein